MAEIKLTATRSALEKIGGKYALSFPVALISFVWASMISVGFDAVRFDTSQAGWFRSALLAHLILILIAIPVRVKVLPVKDRVSKPLFAISFFAFLGLVRSFLMGEFAVYFGLAPTQEYGLRQITGLISVTTGLSVTTIFVASVAERKETFNSLIEQRQKLIAIKDQAETLIAQNQTEIDKIIDESIKPSLEEIKVELSRVGPNEKNIVSNAEKLISSVINERLRPISNRLHQPTKNLGFDQDWKPTLGPKVRISTRVSVQSLINPYLVTLAMSASTVAATIYYAGFSSVPITVLIYLPFLVIALLAKKYTPINWKLKTWQAIPVSVLGHMLAAIPSLLIVSWLSDFYKSLADQFPFAYFGLTSVALAITLLRAVEAEQLQFESEFEAANLETEKTLAILNQQIWVLRRKTAQLLHGSVQAALTAANVRLKQGPLTETELNKVRSDIQRAINSVNDENLLSFDLEDEIENLIELWDGVCQIDVAISPMTLSVLSENSLAAQCVNEFLKECVNNAIKHGQASEIEVKIEINDHEQLSIEVLNNGQYQLENAAGLGTRILDEITTQWFRTWTPAGTKVTGQIALGQALVALD